MLHTCAARPHLNITVSVKRTRTTTAGIILPNAVIILPNAVTCHGIITRAIGNKCSARTRSSPIRRGAARESARARERAICRGAVSLMRPITIFYLCEDFTTNSRTRLTVNCNSIFSYSRSVLSNEKRSISP